MPSGRFIYIWQYEIEPARRSDFLAAYNPGGHWAQLFSLEPSYIETVLLQDIEDANRFMTIDYWRSRSDRDAFRERYSIEFADLDSRCESLTREEKFIGDYTEMDGAPA
jgi:heme-degrading monooxygenase HmoA